MTESAKTTVTRNEERARYEIRVDDAVAGFLLVRPAADGRVVLPHTEVDPAYKGQGLGVTLASEALADLARRGDVVVPECPFVQHYLKENEVAGLVVEWPDEDDATDAASPAEPA
jgi:uncharacterized protein